MSHRLGIVLLCIAGITVACAETTRLTIDGGSVDAVSVDAVSVDAVSVDAVSVDAASVDAVSVDAVSVDAVSVDANVPDAAPVLDPASFQARVRELSCQQPRGCPVALPITSGPDLATCVASLVRHQEASDRQTREYVASGRVRFDPAQAQRCLDDMAQHCAIRHVWEQCYGVFTGTSAAGASCEMAVECAPGTYCDHGASDRFVCPGRCVVAGSAPGTRPTSGLSCAADPGAIALYEGALCLSARFGVPAAVGEACDEVDEGGSRVRLTRCMDGLACAIPSPLAVEGRCVRPRGAGEACARGDYCSGGQRCDATATTAGRCVPSGLTEVAGGPCTAGVRTGGNLPSCDPLAQLECGDDGRCVRVGDGSEGSRCVGAGGTEGLCNPGLFCNVSGTCQRQLPDGAQCARTTMCRSGACLGGLCVARVCG